MSRPTPPNHNLQQRGFTLIEIIITLVITAILSVILVLALGSKISHSGEPIVRLQKTMALQQTMENIRADFEALPSIANLRTAIGTGVQSNGYGSYEVIENSFISFVGYTDAPGVVGDGILKVTIKDDSTGLVLTELFVDW